MNTHIQLIDIATRDVTCLPVDATIGEAASVMAKRRFSSVVVIDNARHPLGIVTERNILHAMRAASPPETPLRTCMSAPVVVVPGTMDCLDAYQICMREGIRHLVLVNDDATVAGVVSETDFRQHLNLTVLSGRQHLISVAQRSVASLPPHSSLLQALNLMQAQRESCVVVIAHEKPVGIVTERDVVRFYSREPERVNVPLAEVMTSPVLTIAADASITQAAELMLEKKVRHLALVDSSGRMVGLASEHGLTQTMASGLMDEKFEVDEIFLRTFIDTIPDLVWLKNEQGVYLACNRRFEQLYGASEAEIIGRTDSDFVDKETADFFLAHDLKAMAADASSINEEWLTFAADGYRGLFETIKTPMRNNQGQLIGVLGVARDITERKQSQYQLELLDHAINASYESVFLADEELTFRYVNDTACRKLDYSREELLTMKPSDIDPGLTLDQGIEMMRHGEQGKTETFETRHRARDGQIFDVEISATIVEFDGKRYGLSVVRDITERKRNEAQLKEYRERLEGLVAEESTKFHALVEQSLVGIYIIQDGYFRYANPGLLRMYGYASMDELVDVVSIFQLVKPSDRSMVEERIRHRVEGEQDDVRYSFTALKRDGSEIVVDVHGRRIEYQGRPAIIGSVVDITEMRRSKEELQRLVEEKSAELQHSEELLRTLIEAIPDSIQFKDGAGRWLESNRAARAAFGLEKVDCQGRTDIELAGIAGPLFSAALQRCHETDEAVWQAGGISRVEEVIPLPDGSELNFDVIKKPLFGEDGQRQGLVIIGRDVTELKTAEAGLRITASVFDNSQEAIVITDADNLIVNVNPAFTHITGYSRDEVLGKNPRILSSGRQDASFYATMWAALNEEHAWRGEIWNRRKSGEIYAELLSISVICDEAGKVQRHVAVFSDITYFKEHEAELSHVANYDALTGIPNRRLLADRLAQAIARAQRSGKMLAICYIDLDGFKDVNDRHGHEIGDLLLVDITHRLQEVLRAGDTLARLGGDEFVVLFNDLSQESECFQVLDRIVETIAAPTHLASSRIAVSASIGVTFYPHDDEDGDTLMHHADQAMYIAKQSGKNRYHLYDTIHDQRLRSMYEARRNVLQGLEAGEFELYYQPKLELATNRIVGVEALIRWNHPDRGLLHPAAFLPALENSDIEIILGNWVMDTALAQLHAWKISGVALQVSINISSHHLQAPDFVAGLQNTLKQYPGLPRGSLQIEVPETVALEDLKHTAALIEECRELGVGFALDDFGTGHSSLVHLSGLGADTLKIDQSFVKDMATRTGDRAIVQGVIALARTFGRQTVAEGVEDEKLIRMLADMGCGYVQGYAIAYPMRASEFMDWYKEARLKLTEI